MKNEEDLTAEEINRANCLHKNVHRVSLLRQLGKSNEKAINNELMVEIERLKDKLFEAEFELAGLRIFKNAIPSGDEQTEIFLMTNKLCPHCLFWRKRIRFLLFIEPRSVWKCQDCESEIPIKHKQSEIMCNADNF